MKPTDSIRTIRGIGEKSEKLFSKLGITTVGELLAFYPREYDIFTKVQPIAAEPRPQGRCARSVPKFSPQSR